VYGDDDTGLPVDPTHYLAQVDLFTVGGYPDYRARGGEFLPVQQNQALFQLLGTTYGGNGETNFVTPDPPSPVAQFAYLTAGSGLFPPG
jgi:microcystin-dependent protein